MEIIKFKDPEILGGRLTKDNQHIIIARIEDGFTIIEKIEASLAEVEDLLDKATNLFFKVKSIWDDLVNNLPTKIRHEGVIFRLNELPAPGKQEDIVLYRSEENGNDILFQTKGRNKHQARNEMFAKLQEESFIF